MATYYVSTAGSDSWSGSQANPFRTVAKGLTVLAAGDTLYLRGGTYAEAIDSNAATIPTGTSWGDAPIIAAYTGETPILTRGMNLVHSYIQYLIIDGLTFDAQHTDYGLSFLNGVHHVRVQNGTVRNVYTQGIQGGFGATTVHHIELLNLSVHDCGDPVEHGPGDGGRYDHGIYMALQYLLIDRCTIYNNTGYGIQIYDSGGGNSSNSVIRNSTIYGNHGDGNVILSHGDSVAFYNNVVYDALNGVTVDYAATNTKIYNNTVYGHVGAGIETKGGSTNAVVKNNIAYGNGANITDTGSGTVQSNNLTADPSVVNLAARDFHLTAGSTNALDLGATLAEVTTDHDGGARPFGSAYDIGAYEYGSTPGDVTPPPEAPPATPPVVWPPVAPPAPPEPLEPITFSAELLTPQAVRRPFIRFCREFNQDGSWTGALDRRYDAVGDSRGAIPHLGTVLSFGSFKNALANHEFTVEVPSITSELADPDNEWRALSDRPSDQILRRRFGYYLRQENENGDLVDQLIAVGQLNGAPRFPNEAVQFNLDVPGGDLLGDQVPRRLLNTRDWPRALPDHWGRVIPFCYGRLINVPGVVIVSTEVEPGGGTGGTNQDLTIIASDTTANYIGSSPFGFEYAIRPTGGTFEACWTLGGAANWAAVGLAIQGPNPAFIQGKGEQKNTAGTTHVLTFDSAVTAGSVIVVGVASILSSAGVDSIPPGCITDSQGNTYTRQATSDHPAVIPQRPTMGLFTAIAGSSGTLQVTYTRVASSSPDAMGIAEFSVESPSIGPTGALSGSGVNATSGPLVTTAASVIVGWMDEYSATTHTPGCSTQGTVTQPSITTTVTCQDSDGVSDQGAAGRGGWLKALLADTGGGVEGLTDYGVPGSLAAAVQSTGHAAPTLSGSVTSGGLGTGSGTAYYAIATVHSDGFLSVLSNVVTANVSAGQKVDLSWSGLASGALAIRVFRGNDPTFQQFDRYRVTGNPYSVNDVSTNETGVSDLWFAVDTRDQLDPDPHWDLIYRQQRYYSVAALYDNGVQSACSALVQVDLAPRNAPLPIQVTWAAPTPPTGRSVVAYIVRRSSQTYSYEIGPDREWSVDASTFVINDTGVDTTAVSPCQTPASQEGGTPKPVYVLAGHCLKSVIDVFVLKPDPASESNEFVQTRMVEGTDFTQEIREINGNRYHCLVFAEQQRSDTCQYYEVSANVEGATYDATTTGDLITSAEDIYDNIMLNIVFNTYRSSVGVYAPPGGQWFTDVPYASGLFNRASVQNAKALGAQYVSGGLLGAGAAIRQQSAQQLIHDLLVSYDLELYQYLGVWYTNRFVPDVLNRINLTAITPTNAIAEGSFTPSLSPEKQINQIPYFAGPIGGDGSKGYLVSGELTDGESYTFYRQLFISEPTYLLWTQDATTAFWVVRQFLRRLRYPPIGCEFTGPVWLYNLTPSTPVVVTHPKGLGPSGFQGRAMRLLSVELQLDTLTCYVTARDIDDLVPSAL